MPKNAYPLALTPAALYPLVPQSGLLDRRLRKALEQHLAEQLRISQEAEAAQQTLAAVYLMTLRTADETFTLAELIKASRFPWLGQAELSELDRQRREAFEECLHEIADRVNEQIVKRFNR
jgi:hypothetical protein